MATGLNNLQHHNMQPQLVTVKPKTSKAKNRLANSMQGNANCVVEQDVNGRLFLASQNKAYFFWVSPTDQHWEII